MGKYQVTARPATMAVFQAVWQSQGVLAANFWAGGPITLDTAQWESQGRPFNNAIYNAAGQYQTGYAVLRVLSVQPGTLGWAVGDFCCVVGRAVNQGNRKTDPYFPSYETFLGLDPTLIPVGSTSQYFIVGVKVVPINDDGTPMTGTPPTGTPPPPVTTGTPIVTGNGGTSQGTPIYYGQPSVQYVQAPPAAQDSIFKDILPILLVSGQQQSQLQAQTQARQDSLDFQAYQLDAARQERAEAREAEERQQRREDAEFKRQQRQIQLQEQREAAEQRRQDRAAARRRRTRQPAPAYYDDETDDLR